MVAELAPQWGKFGRPSGQVRQRPILYSQTFVVGIAKGQEYVTTLTYEWTIQVGSSEYKLNKNLA